MLVTQFLRARKTAVGFADLQQAHDAGSRVSRPIALIAAQTARGSGQVRS